MEDSKLLEIKSQVNIVDLISSYVTLHKSGKNYKAPCPFHNEKTASFMVSPELQIFKCFGCGKGGDIFSFVQEIEGVEFPESVRILGERAGIKVDIKEKNKEVKSRSELISEINNLSADFYNYLLTKHKIGVKALEYLKAQRKLTDKTISEWKLGYAPSAWRNLSDFLVNKKKFRIDDVIASGLVKLSDSKDRNYDLLRGRVIFPIRDINGNVVGFTARTITNEEPKYLNTPETEVFHKGSILFGLDRAKVQIKREGLAIIAEGQLDVISAHQAGFTNVVATSGTALTTDQLKRLAKLTKDIAFCFDSDSAGVSAVERAIELSETENLNVKVIVIPKPYKDLDECIKADPLAFESAKNKPVSIYDFYFIAATSRFDEKDPVSKKKIAEFLGPVIARIKDPILKDHYVKKLAGLLQVSYESVLESISRSLRMQKQHNYQSFAAPVVKSLDEVSSEEYLLNLIMKSPLDLAQTNLYKLGQKDFVDPVLESIFIELKSYILGRKRDFQIKYFCAKLDKALQDRVEAIYLKDVGLELEDEEKLSREIASVLKRTKTSTAKRDLKELSTKIKNAEAVGDVRELERLTKEFKNISERLSTYGY